MDVGKLLPGFVKSLFGGNVAIIEESWNNFPRIETQYTCTSEALPEQPTRSQKTRNTAQQSQGTPPKQNY